MALESSNDSYLTILGKHIDLCELVEKKSRFICHICHTKTVIEATDFLEEIKKKHKEATHNCYAYIIGRSALETKRFSDDGEPSRTAGFPMLEVIENNGLSDIIVVVTRYFGGTKLGASGLVRAYSKASSMGISSLHHSVFKPSKSFEMEADYAEVGKIDYYLSSIEEIYVDKNYEEKVRYHIKVPNDIYIELKEKIEEYTSGRARFKNIQDEYIDF